MACPKESLQISVATGRRLVSKRTKPPWPYRVSDAGVLTPDPVGFAVARLFLQTLERNGGRLAASLEDWRREGGAPLPFATPVALGRWLKHPLLRSGDPPLIEEQRYRALSAQREVNTKMWGQNAARKPRLLTGLVKCSHCGTPMRYAGGRVTPSLLCQQSHCEARYKSIREAEISDAIQAVLRTKRAAIKSAIENPDSDVNKLAAQIRRLEELNDPDLADAIAAKKARMQELNKKLFLDERFMPFLDNPAFLASFPPERLRLVYQELVKEVLVRDRAVEFVRLSL